MKKVFAVIGLALVFPVAFALIQWMTNYWPGLTIGFIFLTVLKFMAIVVFVLGVVFICVHQFFKDQP